MDWRTQEGDEEMQREGRQRMVKKGKQGEGNEKMVCTLTA